MARKGENIFHRKDNRWEARYIKGKDNFGKNVYGYVYGKSYKEAKEKRMKLLSEIKNTNNALLSKETLEYKAKEWLEREKLYIKISTYNYYYNIINKYIITYFKLIKINKIDESYINKFINELENKDLKKSTIKQIIVIFKSILIFSGHNINFKLPKIDKKSIEILSNNEVKQLQRYIINNINNYTIGILIVLHTGIRIGELCALRWENIDLNSSMVTIKNTVSRIKKFDDSFNKTTLIVGKAKTDKSIRYIPIDKYLSKYLLEYKSKYNKDSDYIITGSNKIPDTRTVYFNYQKILKICNIKKHTFHALRHTFATRCCQLGLDIKSLSEILGHSNINTTLAIYVHSNMEYKKNFFDTKFLNF